MSINQMRPGRENRPVIPNLPPIVAGASQSGTGASILAGCDPTRILPSGRSPPGGLCRRSRSSKLSSLQTPAATGVWGGLEALKTLGATSRYTAYALFGLAISGANLSAADDRATAAQRLSRYLQVDTVNPPGNESRGVDYLAGILEKHGIPYSRGESAPGRGNLWARLEGGNEPGLVLLHQRQDAAS